MCKTLSRDAWPTPITFRRRSDANGVNIYFYSFDVHMDLLFGTPKRHQSPPKSFDSDNGCDMCFDRFRVHLQVNEKTKSVKWINRTGHPFTGQVPSSQSYSIGPFVVGDPGDAEPSHERPIFLASNDDQCKIRSVEEAMAALHTWNTGMRQPKSKWRMYAAALSDRSILGIQWGADGWH